MPEVKKRITTFGQVVLIAFGLAVDFIEFILNILLVGVVLNPIISIVVNGIFFLYAHFKGLDSEPWKVYASISGTTIAEAMPGLSLLPFFTFNAWYITHTIKKQDKARLKAAEEEAVAVAEQQKQQEWIENYQMQQQVEQEENAQDEEQENMPPAQEPAWQSESGTGRIAPLKFKAPAEQRQAA